LRALGSGTPAAEAGAMRLRTFLVLMLAASCGNVSEHPDVDAPPMIDAVIDASIDAAIDTPDASTTPKRRGGIVSTSGGGIASSPNHRLRIRIGAPQPIGRTASSGHNLVTGPGALP
jgi:hypothetical protein